MEQNIPSIDSPEIPPKSEGRIISIRNLTFGYSAKTILHDINLDIDEPSFICIIGPNGVGKSTLIRLVNGLIKPKKGTVKVMGKNVSEYKLKEMSKIVGYIPVITSDFSVMTVLDTVMVGRFTHQKWRTSSADVAIAHKALEAMEVDHLAMSNFNELSAGQHQKVAIARGLVQEPKILILDEPTSNLDVRHQMYVMEFLKSLSHKSGMTILMVSHDLNLSAKFADQVIVMEPPGRVRSVGKPSEVIDAAMLKEVYHVESSIVDDDGTPHVLLQQALFDETQ